jgi:hypothetical protein
MNISHCFLIPLWMLAQLAVPALASTTSQLTQHGITWNFSTPVQFGQFVNGDWWVVGPVTVISVSPTPSTGRNGSMVNPTPPGNKPQGYDDRIAYYSAQARAAFPATLAPGSSLVSTKSLTNEDLNVDGRYNVEWLGDDIGTSWTSLKTAAVLTVLASPPSIGTFRPPLVGTSKPLYNVSQIQRQFLPRLPRPSTAPSRSVSHYERGLERPWLVHGYDWQGRMMHPIENMHNYHQQIGEFLSEASMIMVTDLATETLINRYIQTGIDVYHTMILGRADSAFFEWQSIYTGLLLGNETMANVVLSGDAEVGRTGEKFYFWADRSSTVPKSAGVVEGRTWSGASVFFRKQVGSTGEYEHLVPADWGLAYSTTNPDPSLGGVKFEKYRQANDSMPHMGMLLTCRILRAQSRWKTGAPDAYLERWMTEDWSQEAAIINSLYPGVPDNTQWMGSAFMNKMWDLYKYTSASGGGDPSIPPLSLAPPQNLRVVP